MTDLLSQSDFEAGWLAASEGKPLLGFDKVSIGWRNGWREFWAGLGL
jgi:hypothetical protein